MTLIADAWGDNWRVEETRPTRHGFDVFLGRPADGNIRGGRRVIVTPDLASHFEARRLNPSTLTLPIGLSTIKRIRALLGHNRYIDHAAWWDERVTDLADLTIEQFCARHGVTVGAAVNARHALLGPTLRPAGWWRAPDIRAIILSAAPRAEVAERLGISVGSIGRLRYWLRVGRS